MILHFLHGFLGFKSDWDVFKKDFLPSVSFAYSIEDFLPNSNREKNYFVPWAKKFNTFVFSSNNNQIKDKNILIGYSLGGRLALHSLAESNNHWDGVIIISANPGLSDKNEKEARIKNDQNWANRFLIEPWESVITTWNSQGVFSGQKNTFNRQESLYNREKIAEVIDGFSLGKQEDLRYIIKNIKIPVLWISGELDTKFASIGKEISLINKNINSVIIQNTGHRVPWEAPERFKELCTNFIKKIQEGVK